MDQVRSILNFLALSERLQQAECKMRAAGIDPAALEQRLAASAGP